MLFLLAALCLAGVTGQGNHGHHNPHETVETDVALHNIDVHFNDKLCLELLLIDCAKYTMTGDEAICASNGVEYPNHCRFTHARCQFLHGGNQIHVANHGPCPGGATTVSMSNSGASTVTAGPGATGGMTMTTTMGAPATTASSVNSIIKNVFCQNMDSISCTAFNITCGSDHRLYPNQCELSKANCLDPTVTVADMSLCSTTTTTTKP